MYIGAKLKASAEIGINPVHLKLSPETTEEQLIDHIHRLNEDPTVHGIILQVIIYQLEVIVHTSQFYKEWSMDLCQCYKSELQSPNQEFKLSSPPQVPLDCTTGIDESLATNALSPAKDVDGLTDVSAGRLARGDLTRCFTPCTPSGF